MDDTTGNLTLTREELEQLCASANLGDREARSKLSTWLDQNPGTWQAVAAAGTRSEAQLRHAITGGNYLEDECLRRSTEALKASLLSADATPLEVLAAERVAMSWLGIQLAELRLATCDGGSTRSAFWVKAVDSAQRRLAGTMSQLQAIQKVLGRPSCRAAVAKILEGATRPDSVPKNCDSANSIPRSSDAPGDQAAINQSTICAVPTVTNSVQTPGPQTHDSGSTVPFRMP